MIENNSLPANKTQNTFSFEELYASLDCCIDCIIEKLKKGNICAFVGAGFSQNANKGYPDWSTLLIDAYKELSELEKDDDNEKLKKIKIEGETKIAQRYVDLKDYRESIDFYIEKKLKPIDEDSKNNLTVHENLLQLNWADVITTNWDTLLEKANKAFGKYEVVKTAKELRVNNHKRIVKINGSLRSDEEINKGTYYYDGHFDHLYIITEDDFSSYEQKHNDFSNFMKVELLENSFCLFGFSGHDPNFHYWIRNLKEIMTRGGNTEEPNPIFMFTICDTKDVALRQFYRNNYIIPIFIDDVIQKIESAKSEVIPKSITEFTKTITDYPVSQKFNILFDYLNEMSSDNDETLKAQNQLADHWVLIIDRKTDILTESQMQAYNRLELFDFSNLQYTEVFVELLRQYVLKCDNYPELFYNFLSNWLTSNYYSLYLLFSADVIPKVLERYRSDFLPQKKAVEFLNHALEYWRENDVSLFNEICDTYLKIEEYSNAIYYQRLLLYAHSFNYRELKTSLSEWKPEKTKSSYTALYILRKIYFILLFENRKMISDLYPELNKLFEKAEKELDLDSQLLFFIYDLHARVLYSMKSEKLNSLEKKRTVLAEKFKSFKQYLVKLNFEEIDKNFYKPNVDIRKRSVDVSKIRENKIKNRFH